MKSKLLKIIKWVIIALLSIQFLAAGFAKLMGSWDALFERWGYSLAFAYLIGIAELLLIIGLYFSKIRPYSILVIIIIMSGAIYTHIAASEYSRIIHNLVLIFLSAGIYLVDKWLEK